MPRPHRVPYFVVEANVSENAKLAALPTDEARLGYFYVCLGRAKLQRPQGRFASRSHWRDVAGRFARHLNPYVKSGLLHIAPDLCDDCRRDWGELAPGTIVVHNYLRHQTDPWSASRSEAWRENADRTLNDTPIERNTNAERTLKDTAIDTAISRTRATRARAETLRHRDVESLSLEENRSPTPSREAEPERSDVAALLARGWRVTAKQRGVLDEVLDRHDVTGAEWAARIIRDTPQDGDPFRAVLEADERWQRERREQADAEDASWQATKAASRQEAVGVYADLFEQ